ncbi:MAG TPA: thymidylate kinase [Blastocatellia bacterium]|nr:thymidylate kinase [Blastocatellia bacterium]
MYEQENNHRFEFYGEGLPGVDLSELRGRLIVIEGPDGVGRSTQVSMLKPWLESNGHAVLDTGMTRSALAGKGIKQAKEGITLGPISLSLFYATDFADRLENEMIPALRAGFIVLTDRYIYSLMARAIVRGLDAAWIKSVYGMALKPDAVFYLRAELKDLIPRVLSSPTGFDYWESGMDMHLGEDLFDSFNIYQTKMLSVFDSMIDEYGFEVIDATQPIDTIYRSLQRRIGRLLREMY